MELKEVLSRIEDFSAADIVNFLCENNLSYGDLNDAIKKNGGWDSAEKRKNVQELLKQIDRDAYNTAVLANTVEAFQKYLSQYPKGNYYAMAQTRIQALNDSASVVELKEREKNAVWQEIIDNPNSLTPDELIEKGITAKDIRELSISSIPDGIIEALYKYEKPNLVHGPIPKNLSEIPLDYTDIFFWGIPSSGKTCALATIIDTMKRHYTIDEPAIEIKFGAKYRNSLDNIFNDQTGIGNLPDRTVEDRTQYMPFLFKRRGERNYRKISFFELSGEVFKHFHYLTYGNDNEVSEDDKVKIGFDTLKLLLNSSNQKIHYFFIDYDYQTQNNKQSGWTQAQYLEAAATYFRDNDDIFKKRTDAVNVVITKADMIKGDKKELAKEFLEKNFGSFMDVIQTRCRKDSIQFKIKIFSIGKVWFKRICEIDPSYAHSIIEDLLKKVDCQNDSKIGRFFNR